MTTLELDHVFVFVTLDAAMPGGWVDARLTDLGLQPSYARRHEGQGTANVCFCFDNAYLELLFVVDVAELERTDVVRNGFVRRSRWADTGSCPFGIAVRGGPAPFQTWDYRIDAFPPGLSIPVAEASDDPVQPFVFVSPGNSPPIDWSNGLAGSRQTGAGLHRLSIERLALPEAASAAPMLDDLVSAGLIGRVDRTGGSHRMVLRIDEDLRVELPSFAVL